MYVNFAYAHKASSDSVDDAPYLKHKVRLHVVNEPWLEAEATSTLRTTSDLWSAQYLALDGSDAESSHLTTTTMNISSPSRFVEFKVGKSIRGAYLYADGALGGSCIFRYFDHLYLYILTSIEFCCAD